MIGCEDVFMKPMRGKAWVFPGVLDVDWEIYPYPVTHELRAKGILTKEEMGKYCMTKVDPGFPQKVKSGDFIVGEYMGFGHDHHEACLSILGAGVAAVICETAATYFFRNSIEHGLPVIALPGILNAVNQGDELELDLIRAHVTNLTTGEKMDFERMPTFILNRLQAGGMIEFLRMELEAGRIPRRLAGR
jgi:3-isopropylmalate/(R)-2-methylmalate dehydratase small subunit